MELPRCLSAPGCIFGTACASLKLTRALQKRKRNRVTQCCRYRHTSKRKYDRKHPAAPRDPTGPLLARPVRVSTSTSTDGSGSPNLCRFSTFPSPGGGYFNTADPYGGGGSGFYSPPAVIDDNDALPNDRRIVVAEPDDFWSDWPQGIDIWRHVDAFLARKESGDIPESCYHLDFIPSVEIPALDNS
ncbi:hypothetical protein K438DRAFT_1992130 [Mycena galopus ATCC 62051]|nr:hypothetical protein K438DRAFT_1992130 [Mycena galopus ATCC 62051]